MYIIAQSEIIDNFTLIECLANTGAKMVKYYFLFPYDVFFANARIVRCLCLAFLLLFATSISTHSVQVNYDSQLKEIFKNLKSRREFLDPFKAEIRFYNFQSQKYLDSFPKNSVNSFTVSPEAKYTLMTRGGKIRESSEERDSKLMGKVSFLLSNGKNTFWPHFQDKCFNMSSGPPKFHVCLTPTEVMGENALYKSIESAESGRDAATSIAIRSVQQENQDLVVTFFFPKSKWTNRVSFVPSMGYAIRSLSVIDERGRLLGRSTVDEFYGPDVGFYPRKGIIESFLPSLGNNQPPQMTQRFEVVATCDPSAVPESTFAFAFPKGSQFYDTDLGVWVRDVDLVESHLNDVVAELRNEGKPLYRWALAVVIGIIVILLIWKIRTRTQ